MKNNIKSNKHKISIIIPVYNSEKYLSRCIDSVINQTYKDLEVILINDGSTDDSLNVLKTYESLDNRIVIIDQKNQGVAKTRNKGLQKATGDYIMFIDNDDFLDTDYIETMYQGIEDNDIVVSGYKRVTNNKILLNKIIKNNGFGIYENVAPWGKLIKKDYLIKNDIKFFSYPIGEDIIFNLKLYSLTNKIFVIDNSNYNWYFNDSSVSNTKQKSFDKDIINLYKEMIKYDNNEYAHYFIARYHIWYLLFSGKYSSKKEFLEEYTKLINWMKNNKYDKGFNIQKIIKNETSFKNKMIILIFYLFEKIHLVSLFSKIYCKG